jgi:hypothetical protein
MAWDGMAWSRKDKERVRLNKPGQARPSQAKPCLENK